METMTQPKKYYSKEERDAKMGQIQQFMNLGDTIRDATRKVGVPEHSYYRWVRITQPSEGSERPRSVVLSFEAIPVEQARDLATPRRGGRFSEFTIDLINQLALLEQTKALSIPLPRNSTAKEIRAINVACRHAVRKHNLPFKVRHSKAKGLILVFHADSLKGGK